MSTSPTHVKFTYEDYLGFPEDGNRHELIEGDHYVTPAPLTRHQRIVTTLLASIYQHCQQTQAGVVFSAPTDVVFSPSDVVQPDVLFIARTREDIVTRENIQGAPDFIIEILSDSTRHRDERTKRTLYERYQVSEYWIIDPDRETVKIFRLQDGLYRSTQEFRMKGPESTLTTPLLPGFSLTLKDVFS